VDAFLGEIQAFPYAFAIQGFNQAWLPCFGQTLPIQAYSALYSLIGTIYGGNGTTQFQLPNLNGLITNGVGTGPGLQPRVIGESLGAPTVTLTTAEIASHTHGLQLGVRTATGATPGPGAAQTTAVIDPAFNGFVAPPSTTTLSPNAMALTGQSQPHDNNQPTLAIVWCICFNGVYPSFTS
jgi:microcystin-dependent protein